MLIKSFLYVLCSFISLMVSFVCLFLLFADLFLSVVEQFHLYTLGFPLKPPKLAQNPDLSGMSLVFA